MIETVFCVFLHSLGITHKKLHTIFGENQNYKEVFENLDTLGKIAWFSGEKIDDLKNRKQNLDQEKIQKILEKNQISIVTFFDMEYPESLRHIANPPFILYVQWKIGTKPKIAVIGSRKMTNYWEQVIDEIVPKLSAYFTIVSGGAFWCDTKAHIATLNSHSSTIVVVWTGIDITHPESNKRLYEAIVRQWWAIISSFPLSTEWSKFTFPIRNEIISGISKWVLVIEAAEKSWTLITVKLALEQWKEIFVIPWDIFKQNSFGCLELIKKGEAKMVTRVEDILEEYNIWYGVQDTKEKVFEDVLENEIYNYIILEAKTINDIAKKFSLEVSQVSQKLSFLELKGYISKTSQGKYQIH